MNNAGTANNKDQKDNRRFKPGGLLWIVACGLLLCIGVFYLSRSFDKRTEQYAFLAQSILNVLIFVAIAVQAWIYQGQWNVMERQTGILARSVRAAEDAAIAAKKSADTAERALILTERANIEIAEWRAEIKRVQNEAWLLGTFKVLNTGRLGAFIKRIDVSEARYGYDRRPITAFSLRSAAEITQGFDFKLPANHNRAGESIEVTVGIVYSDKFRCRRIRFGWNTYDVTDQPEWRQSFGPDFNHETEYDCDGQPNGEKPN